MFSVYTVSTKVKYLGMTTVHTTSLPWFSLLTSKLGYGKSLWFFLNAKIYAFFVLNSS